MTGLAGCRSSTRTTKASARHAEAARLIEAVTSADGIIVSCPEYAHGVPGGMKNALDWLVSRDAAVGKPAMLVHASARSLYARAALAEIMRTMSFAMYEDAVLEIALLGKKRPEMESDPGRGREPAGYARSGAGFREFYTRKRSLVILGRSKERSDAAQTLGSMP